MCTQGAVQRQCARLPLCSCPCTSHIKHKTDTRHTQRKHAPADRREGKPPSSATAGSGPCTSHCSSCVSPSPSSEASAVMFKSVLGRTCVFVCVCVCMQTQMCMHQQAMHTQSRECKHPETNNPPLKLICILGTEVRDSTLPESLLSMGSELKDFRTSLRVV